MLLFNIKINYSQDVKENDSIVLNDTLTKPQLLLGKITRNAKGYIKINKEEGKLYLYDKAELYYLDT